MNAKSASLALLLLAGAAVTACSKRRPPLRALRVAADTAVTTISQGESVDLRPHLVRGEWTLFEFYADW